MTLPVPALGTFNADRVQVPGSATAAAHGAVALTEHERTAVRSVVVLTLAAVLAAKSRDWLKLAKGWERDGRFDRESFDREITSTFLTVFSQPLVPVLSGMLLLGRQALDDSLDGAIEKRDDALRVADSWARKYAQAVARDYGAQSALAVAAALPGWLARRLPASALAQRAKEMYGLDPRSAQSYENYASGKVVTRSMNLRGFFEKLLERRAETTAKVQSFTALNYGRQMLFAEAVHRGSIPASSRKVWVTAIDERVCEVCAPMDGVAVPVLDRFEVLFPAPKTERGKARPNAKMMVPPVHPNCRCTIVVDKAFTGGIITRTARYSDSGAKHLARVVSRAEDLVLR